MQYTVVNLGNAFILNNIFKVIPFLFNPFKLPASVIKVNHCTVIIHAGSRITGVIKVYFGYVPVVGRCKIPVILLVSKRPVVIVYSIVIHTLSIIKQRYLMVKRIKVWPVLPVL